MTRQHAFAIGILTLSCVVSAPPSFAARRPLPVSPGTASESAVVEARCPTFSWAGVPGAAGYELAVYSVSTAESSEEPQLVVRASLPAETRAWTPAGSQCLERGQRYAWSVAARAKGDGAAPEWAPAALFEIDAAPSEGEVELAVATLQRYLDRARGTRSRDDASRTAALTATTTGHEGRRDESIEASGASAAAGVVRIASAAATPSFANSGALSVSGQIHLQASSAVFKANAALEQDIFLWENETDRNLALGRDALASVGTGSATHNTAFGREALLNNKGNFASFVNGSYNTGIGDQALRDNTYGFGNTAVGYQALESNLESDANTAVGFKALATVSASNQNTAVGAYALQNATAGSNTAVGVRALRIVQGTNNTAIGVAAGENANGNSNILINNLGGTESNVLRIGVGTGNGNLQLEKAFIHGIWDITPSAATRPVVIDSNGQLGAPNPAPSTRRVKQDIHDLGEHADRLLELRPVTFRFKQAVAADPEAGIEFGLIAEEVAEIFPELVVYDPDGSPASVKYQLLSSLLLGQVRAQHAELEEQRERADRQEAEVSRLRQRLDELESRR